MYVKSEPKGGESQAKNMKIQAHQAQWMTGTLGWLLRVWILFRVHVKRGVRGKCQNRVTNVYV
jgi:hypothetical protein